MWRMIRTTDRSKWVHWGLNVIIFLNAAWVLLIPCFPTLDGWAHLQTAQMLFSNGVDGIFCPNPALVPNIMGHIVLWALQTVLPGLLAERALLALIIWGMGWGAYSLMRAYGGRSPLIVLVLPFTINFLLLMGFHNFLLGFGLALIGAAWWIRWSSRPWSKAIAITLFTLLLFYTHTMALAFFLLIAGVHELCSIALKDHDAHRPRERFRGLILLILSSVPAILLFLSFSIAQTATWGTLDTANRWEELRDLRSLLLLASEQEAKFQMATGLLLFSTLVLAVYIRTRPSASRSWLRFSDQPLVIGLFFLLLYFVLPDSAGQASYIALRLQLMFIFLLVIWIGSQPITHTAAIVPVLGILVLHQARKDHIAQATSPAKDNIEAVVEASAVIPDGSIVFPLTYDSNWLFGHMPSLLSVDRDITVIENYECALEYFPFVWCPDLPFPISEHLRGRGRCLGWLDEHIRTGNAPRIDHIVIMGHGRNTDGCDHDNLENVLQRYFHLTLKNNYTEVYQLTR